MELKRFKSTTIKRLKNLRIITGKTYEEIIDDAVSKYYLNAIEGKLEDLSEVSINFSVPANLYKEFNKSVSKIGLTPSDLLSYFVELLVKDE